MKFQCDCGAFTADTGEGWKSSPGRLVCYCDDCQEYASQIGRADVLDDFGGSEIIPVYPKHISITSGAENLCHTALSDKGPIRLSTTCCNSPILNTRANFPWAGVFNTAFLAADQNALEKFGKVKARIMGEFAKPSAPFKISRKISPLDMLVVMPFIIKGKITGKHKGSAFFKEDGVTPVSAHRE